MIRVYLPIPLQRRNLGVDSCGLHLKLTQRTIDDLYCLNQFCKIPFVSASVSAILARYLQRCFENAHSNHHSLLFVSLISAQLADNMQNMQTGNLQGPQFYSITNLSNGASDLLFGQGRQRCPICPNSSLKCPSASPPITPCT